MKIRSCIVIVFGLSMLAGCQSWRKDVSDWTKYSDEEGKYSVTMPPSPERKTGKRDEAPAGKPFTVDTHSAEATSKHTQFIVTWCDYPPELSCDLDATAAAVVQELDGTLGGKEDIQVKEFKGIEFTANVKKPKSCGAVGRVIAVKKGQFNRGYVLLASGDGFVKADAAVRTFLDSFTLNLTEGPSSSGTPSGPSASTAGLDKDWTQVKLSIPSRGLLPTMVWAPDGDHFFALNGENGDLQKVPVAKDEEPKTLALGRPTTWLSMSAQGLLVSCPAVGNGIEELLLVDPIKMTVRNTIQVKYLKRAVGTLQSSLALAWNPGIVGSAQNPGPHIGLSLVNLVTNEVTPLTSPQDAKAVWFAKPIMSPRGTEFYTQADVGMIARCVFGPAATAVTIAKRSPIVRPGRRGNEEWITLELCLSPDGRYICLPAEKGNVYADNSGSGKSYTTLIFDTNDIGGTPVCMIQQGGPIHLVAFDTAAGLIYSHNNYAHLQVFDMKGHKLRSYGLGAAAGKVAGMLVHPKGRKVVLMTTDGVYCVQIPENLKL